MESPQEGPLSYTIAHATAHSGRYSCENILVNNPGDQNSRWSGAYQGSTKQWILLRLDSLAVLRRITFGKFSKPHPCNMKEFKLYIGMTEDNMVEVFHGGLKNNADAETFEIKHINEMGVAVPTRYVKIEPIASHGQNFHVSVWFVSLAGHGDPGYIEQVRSIYEEHRERIVLRHILKHLRQCRLLSPFKSVVERSGLRLEHPLVSQLHESVVLQGDWQLAEKLLSNLSENELFFDYLRSSEPQAFWTRITGTDADGDIPSPRGGHAMCLDPDRQIVYLFGGWDGVKSLDDFWAYRIKDDKWHLLSTSTSNEPNAPGARSCHKMVFDVKTGNIYLIGRLADSDVKPLHTRAANSTATTNGAPGSTSSVAQASPLRQQITPPASQTASPVVAAKTYCSEFYRYQTQGLDAGKWVFLSFDTATSGGPPLVYDHQLVIDSDSQMIYMFGGRVVDGDWETAKYSGLYSYNIRMSKWKLLQAVDPSGTFPNAIPPRYGHSMVLEPNAKKLFIFGGQRDPRYLSDMYVYDINTNVSTQLSSNFSSDGGPDPCFTQRAVIDPSLKEIYVFCGLTRSASSSSHNTALKTNPSNWVYRYDPQPGKWTHIIRHPDSPSNEVPLPRFAHQVVYHPDSKTVFLHGGNAGGLTAVEKDKPNGGGNPNSESSTSVNLDGAPTSGDQPSPDPRSNTPPVIPAERSRTQSPSTTKEKRLDDFWKMEMRRPSVAEVIRRAKFRIRRQQFREMCEEVSPVRALQFLQTEVSSVVDHKDTHESEAFRGLLTYLLAPPHQSSIPPSAPMQSTRSSSQASGVSEFSTEEETHPGVARRGRRRLSDQSGIWTNQLPGDGDDDVGTEADALHSNRHPLPRGTAETLRGIVDPLELSAAGRAMKPISLTSDRYQQRTEVFSSILEFVSEEEREPAGDLLHLIMGQNKLYDGPVL